MDYDRLNSLFDVASKLSRDERTQFIARMCADDPEMADELAGLLQADDGVGYLFY